MRPRVLEQRVRQLRVMKERVVPAETEELDDAAQRGPGVLDEVLVAELEVPILRGDLRRPLDDAEPAGGGFLDRLVAPVLGKEEVRRRDVAAVADDVDELGARPA